MTTSNGTIYCSETFQVGNVKWEMLVTSGKLNYVSLYKRDTRGRIGKEFRDLDEALANYKSIKMKAALMQVHGLIVKKINS